MIQDDLLQAALLGTERSQQMPTLDDSDVGVCLSRVIEGQEPAAALLKLAAATEMLAVTGHEPAEIEATVAALPSRESKPCAKMSRALDVALTDGSNRLRHELFTILRKGGLRLPAQLLPRALEIGRRSVELRPALVEVIGNRGRWLAGQNEAWKFADGADAGASDDVVWVEGSLEQRCEVLRRWRQHNPAQACDRLASEFAQLPVNERVALVGALRTGLSLSDEAFLESVLNDRSKEVRLQAATLLAVLPDSGYAQRMQGRLAALLNQRSGVLGVGGKWMIDAPTQADATWKADGIETERPRNESLGERAWWLKQLVSRTHPAWWSEHTRMLPGELVQWAAKTDWQEALVQGWIIAINANPLEGWASALLAHAGKSLDWNQRNALAKAVPLSEREQQWAQAFRRSPLARDLSHNIAEMVECVKLGEQFSATFSQQLGQHLAQQVQNGSLERSHHIHSSLGDIVAMLHPTALPWLRNLKAHEGASASYVQLLSQTSQAADARLAIYQLIASNTKA